jgi:hypothetical protein
LYSTILHAEPTLKNFDVEVRITRKEEASAFPDKEEMLIGWKEIADFLGLYEITAIRLYGKSFKREGVVFYKKVKKIGHDQARRWVCTWPTLIMAWSVRKSQGEQDELRRTILDILRRVV